MVDKKKIALLSNVTLDLIIGKLRRKYDFYQPNGFDTWVQEVINPTAGFYSYSADAVIVLLDGTEARSWKNTEEGLERIELWKQALNALTSSITSTPVFISTIDIRENRIKSLSERRLKYEIENDWYQYVQGLVEERDNIYIFDLADTIADVGRNKFYSNKMWYMSNMPYSRDGLVTVSNEIDRILSSTFESRKKIIALDLDNTLWGGVIGEDGVGGIELSNHKEGQRYYDFQRQLLEMKRRGIVLGISSKNNENDAEEVIQNHPDMLLRDDDFVSRKINWENKTVNLRAMEMELNLTEGSFIFIDDNPIEREMVMGECPEITVPEFPEESTELLQFAEDIWFDYCRPLRVLGEDINKTQMYQTEVRRKHEFNESLDIDDYIKKLEMVVNIHRLKASELERVVQLINKTNQFNVTTKRYTKVEVEKINSNPDNAIYVVYSSDKYGDSGLIGVLIILGNSNRIFHIDTFLMSCRVMGRKLEDVIINEVAHKYTGKLTAEYIPTTKNEPVKNLYDRLGFVMVEEVDGHKKYELITSDYEHRNFSVYKEIRFEK